MDKGFTDQYLPDYGDFSLDSSALSAQAPDPEPALSCPEPATVSFTPSPAPPARDSGTTKTIHRVDLDRLIEDMGGLDDSIPDLYAAADAAARRSIPLRRSKAANSSDRILDSESGSSGDSSDPEERYLRKVAQKEAARLDVQERRRRKGRSVNEDDRADEDIAAATTGKTARSVSPLWEKLKGPVVRFFATLTAKRELRAQEAASWPAPVILRDTPELSPKKAARYYAGQIRSLTLRLLLALFMSLVLMWIGFDLPMAGKLEQSMSLRAAVSLVFLLAVMVAALDIVTDGLRQLCRLRPGMEALAVTGCAGAILDAALVMLGRSSALPYCACAALSLTAALWGQRLICFASAVNFTTASAIKSQSVLCAEACDEDGRKALIRSERRHEGIVRRSEEPDLSRNAYAAAAVPLLLLSLTLALLGCLDGSWEFFLHRLSAYLCVSCSFGCFLCFCLPYLFAAVRLRRTGAAIAGWPGCAEIGRTRRVIVSDTDMFPRGTIALQRVNIADGVAPEKVISYTVSLLKASGSSVSAAFEELVNQRKYPTELVDEFKCHDGGGLSGFIAGENVRMGTVGFMNLMGTRLPPGLSADNSICVSFSDELVAVIEMKYTPIKGVRHALYLLTRGRTQPVFAIRDFNITPLMIQELFHVPAINFEFPSFRERYRLSTAVGRADTPPAALLAKDSLRCAVETTERGRKLYSATLWNTVISLAASAVGLLLIFLLGRSGGEVLSAGRLLAYLLLWTAPVLGISYWVYR